MRGFGGKFRPVKVDVEAERLVIRLALAETRRGGEVLFRVVQHDARVDEPHLARLRVNERVASGLEVEHEEVAVVGFVFRHVNDLAEDTLRQVLLFQADGHAFSKIERATPAG